MKQKIKAMIKVLAWSIICLFSVAAILMFISNIKNAGWYFIGSMLFIFICGAAVLWAVHVVNKPNKKNEAGERK